MLEVIVIFALFATVFPIGKMSLLYCQPIFLTSIRMICAGLLLIAYHFITYRQKGGTQKIVFDTSLMWNIILLSVFNVYLTNVCEFWGLQYLSSGKACFIYNLSPFISALISYFIFSEVMTYKKWIGLFIGFSGFFPILLHNTAVETAVGGIGFLSWPELSLMTAATSTVIGWIIMRRVVQAGVPVFYANGWSMLVGGIGALVTSYITESWNPMPFVDYKIFLGYMIIIMLISNIFCYNIYAYLLKTYTATFLTFVGFTCPLWAALYGWLFLRESISSSFIVSCIAVTIGLYMFYSEEIRLGYVRHH